MNFLNYELLTNILFIITSLFLYQLFIDSKGKASLKQRQIGTFVTTGLAIILCMTFPVRYNSDFSFDLRQIPLWLGSLHGGPLVASGLFLVTTIYDSFLEVKGVIATISVSSFVLFISLKLYISLDNFSFKNRITLIVNLSLLSSLLSTFFLSLTSDSGPLIRSKIVYVAIQGIGMFIISYMAELLKLNFALKEQLIKTENLEMVSHLAASIAHEVRNPLTASRGFMQLLSKEGLKCKHKEYINYSINEIDRAELIIRNFLTYAKPDIRHKAKLNIEQEIEHCLSILYPLANMNTVKVTKDLVDGIFVSGDRKLLQQSLVNIIKNAIEAMPNGGDLLIKTGIDKQSNTVFISIGDSGIGMTEVQLKRVGEPYFSTKGGEGTGLGMMVVYRIISEMNGVTEHIISGLDFHINPAENLK